MGFIRIFSTKVETVYAAENIAAIHNNIFGNKPSKDRPSVYRVDSVQDEVMVTSAHALANVSPTTDTLHILRIDEVDIEPSGVTVSDDSLGETGIVSVDFAHKELLGTRTNFEMLTKRIFDGFLLGEDRVRRISRSQIRRQMISFTQMGREQVTPYAVRQSCLALNGAGTGFQTVGGYVPGEYDGVAAKIPQGVIQLRDYWK